MNDLAIVIPAYKATYFEKTLNSLAQQTNKQFTVYIGDDCSPFNLQTIVDKYKNLLTIKYTRFPNNIGAKNLVLQWRRCVELTARERWICLFSDDDLMDENGVESFFQTVKNTENAFDVYRFNTVTIDENDKAINKGIVGPQIESSAQMAYHLLKGERGNSMPDHIFSRRVYVASGGFVFTEYAQGADWAASILFSREKGICTIPDAKVYWRYSGLNISSTAARNKSRMINGHLQFMSWALKHFEYLKTASSPITYGMMIDAVRMNFKIVMLYHYKGFNYRQTLSLLNFYHKQLKLPFRDSFKELIEIDGGYDRFVRRFRQFGSKIKNIILLRSARNTH